jgi:hypothetical protein
MAGSITSVRMTKAGKSQRREVMYSCPKVKKNDKVFEIISAIRILITIKNSFTQVIVIARI